MSTARKKNVSENILCLLVETRLAVEFRSKSEIKKIKHKPPAWGILYGMVLVHYRIHLYSWY